MSNAELQLIYCNKSMTLHLHNLLMWPYCNLKYTETALNVHELLIYDSITDHIKL